VVSRRAVVAVACASVAATALPFVTAADAAATPKGYPRAGCFDFKDPSGDAPALNADNPMSDPDLDILGVAFEKTAKDFKAFIKVNKLGAGPSASTDGHRYTVSFLFNGHVFSLAGSHFAHGSGAIRDGLASTGQAGHSTQLGVDIPSVTSTAAVSGRTSGNLGYKTSGLTLTWDTKNSWVVVSLPIADIQKYGGAKFTGTLQELAAFSANDLYAVSETSDTTEQGNSATYTGIWKVGANKCFITPKKR